MRGKFLKHFPTDTCPSDPGGIQNIKLQSFKQNVHLRFKAGYLNAPLKHLQDFQAGFMIVTSFFSFYSAKCFRRVKCTKRAVILLMFYQGNLLARNSSKVSQIVLNITQTHFCQKPGSIKLPIFCQNFMLKIFLFYVKQLNSSLNFHFESLQ